MGYDVGLMGQEWYGAFPCRGNSLPFLPGTSGSHVHH